MSFSDSLMDDTRRVRTRWRRNRVRKSRFHTNLTDEFIDLLAAHVIRRDDGVQGGVTDGRVTVADVNRDLTQGLCRCLLEDQHPTETHQTSQFLQTFWNINI